MDLIFRGGGPEDVEHVKRALYAAVDWNPERELPSYGVAIEHPELALYHRGWGRPGDLAVVAELEQDVVGLAGCRLFTDSDHGHGYLDDRTLELFIAVAEQVRGRGIGTSLLEDLARAAAAAGFERLSLSVEATNPARALYERVGYREHSVDERGVRMVMDLER